MAKSILGYKEDKPRSFASSSVTPESIMQSLFTFRDTAHKYHLNCFLKGTGSYAEHKALDKLYKGIQEFQDDILEELMGYMGQPINADTTQVSIPSYTGVDDSVKLCDDIINFCYNLIDFASSRKYSNIENITQELSGLAAQTKYFLMFK